MVASDELVSTSGRQTEGTLGPCAVGTGRTPSRARARWVPFVGAAPLAYRPAAVAVDADHAPGAVMAVPGQRGVDAAAGRLPAAAAGRQTPGTPASPGRARPRPQLVGPIDGNLVRTLVLAVVALGGLAPHDASAAAQGKDGGPASPADEEGEEGAKDRPAGPEHEEAEKGATDRPSGPRDPEREEV